MITCSFVEEGKWKDFSFPVLTHVYKDSTRITPWYENREVYSQFIFSWTRQKLL